MKITVERAEEKLGQKLRAGGNLSDRKHVLHIRGLTFNSKDFEALPDLITGWIGEAGGEMFVCHDRDIFVFSPNLSPKAFTWLKEHFQTRFEYEPSVQARLLSFYDIENNGLALTELADTKLAKRTEAEKQEAAQKHIATKEQRRAEFLKDLPHPQLAGTVDKRRRARATLEILVVEDDPFSRKLIGAALNGHSVSFAEDGRAAVTAHLQKAADIVFLDIDLPDVSGHDVLAKILSFDSRAYIVMLSGNSQIENIQGAVHAGAKGFVGKPFTKEKLLQYIEKCSHSQLEKTGA